MSTYDDSIYNYRFGDDYKIRTFFYRAFKGGHCQPESAFIVLNRKRVMQQE